MKKRLLPLAAFVLLLAPATPALADQPNQEKGQTAGKHHNFDQWQTIKRLQMHR